MKKNKKGTIQCKLENTKIKAVLGNGFEVKEILLPNEYISCYVRMRFPLCEGDILAVLKLDENSVRIIFDNNSEEIHDSFIVEFPDKKTAVKEFQRLEKLELEKILRVIPYYGDTRVIHYERITLQFTPGLFTENQVRQIIIEVGQKLNKEIYEEEIQVKISTMFLTAQILVAQSEFTEKILKKLGDLKLKCTIKKDFVSEMKINQLIYQCRESQIKENIKLMNEQVNKQNHILLEAEPFSEKKGYKLKVLISSPDPNILHSAFDLIERSLVGTSVQGREHELFHNSILKFCQELEKEPKFVDKIKVWIDNDLRKIEVYSADSSLETEAVKLI